MSNQADAFDKANAKQSSQRSYIPHGRTLLTVTAMRQDVTFKTKQDYFLTTFDLIAPLRGKEAVARALDDAQGPSVCYYQDMMYDSNMEPLKAFLQVAYDAKNGKPTVLNKKAFNEAIGPEQGIVGATVVCDAFQSRKKDGSPGITKYTWRLATQADLDLAGRFKVKQQEAEDRLFDQIGGPVSDPVAEGPDLEGDDLPF